MNGLRLQEPMQVAEIAFLGNAFYFIPAPDYPFNQTRNDSDMMNESSHEKTLYSMVVMDDREQCGLLSGLLGKAGFLVIAFGSAEEVLSALDHTSPPQIIITGLSLPGMDGWQFCRLLRSPVYSAFNQVPIIAVSAAFLSADAGRIAVDLGVDAFIPFSVEGEFFIRRIREVLDGRTSRDKIRVLIVDEDNDHSLMLRESFEANGYAVDSAFSEDEAAKAINGSSYDIAVIDHGLAGGTGERLLSDFRKNSPECVFIFMICNLIPDPSLALIRQGASDCLRKPFDPEYLVERCFRALRERNLLRVHDLLEARTRELQDSEKKLEAVFETFDDLYYQTDLTGMVTMISPSVDRLSGWSREEIIGKPVTMVYDEPGARRDLLKAMAEQGYLRDYELSLVKKDGTKTWVSLAAHLVHDSSGAVTGLAGSLRDISHRKQIEEALKESEEKFRILTESSPTAIMLYQNDKWVYANTAATEITGYTVDEFRTMDFWDIVHPDDREMIRERGLKRQKAEAVTPRYELKVISKHGKVKWVYLSGATTHLGGKPAGIISVLDITDRKQAEEDLKKSEERFRTILDEMEVGYLEVDLDGKLTFFNEAFQRTFGYSRDEMMGVNSGHYAAEEEIAKKIYYAYNQMLHTGFPLKSFEWEVIQKGGSKQTFELFTSLLKDFQGQPVGFRGIVRDITDRSLAEEERERLQSQLNQIQKMDSVGRLAGGVAHDFNNMLGVILGRTEIGLMRADPGQPLYQDLTEIRKAAERSSDLTRQLLAFARKQTVAPKVLDLNEVVEGMLKMLHRLIGEDIDLVWRPGENLPPIKMDTTQIDQILANLCVNARDAIAGVGRVIIETGMVDFDQNRCADYLGLVPGCYVRLSVTDDGCGMNDETQEKLFEPFFTTKSAGLGTGLGLATVYGIVKQNNGFIDVDSEPGIGSTFKIHLPIHAGRPERVTCETETPASRGAETILLVEDEPMILEMAGMMLEYLGYNVLSTGLPIEAIRLAENHTGKIHLLLTDVIMPGMTGLDLAMSLTLRDPDIKCMFMSGYTADVIALHGVLDEGVYFIQKPFTMKDLADKVRETLAAEKKN